MSDHTLSGEEIAIKCNKGLKKAENSCHNVYKN